MQHGPRNCHMLNCVWLSCDSTDWPSRLLCPWDFPARILEWVAISFSRGSSQHRDQTSISCIAGIFFTVWTTKGETKFGPPLSGRNQGSQETLMAHGHQAQMTAPSRHPTINRLKAPEAASPFKATTATPSQTWFTEGWLGRWGWGGERGRGREIEGKGVAPELESKFQVTIDRNSVLHTVSIHRSQQGRPHSSPVQGKSNALDSLPTNPEAALATCAPGQVPWVLSASVTSFIKWAWKN